jgi:hypothetical protein
MLTKEISDTEKEIENQAELLTCLDCLDNYGYSREETLADFYFEWRDLKAKLSTLKFAQAKFNRFVGRLKEKDFIMSILKDCVTIDEEEGMKFICIDEVRQKIDELSSKQEEISKWK